ncbi:hypothetical protein, partial [Pseudomonas helleri]|uniref:hypothetical protein n=1 Tax=Pseudomonas helleri TaxID=1608996 RepID=UPI001E323341
ASRAQGVGAYPTRLTEFSGVPAYTPRTDHNFFGRAVTTLDVSLCTAFTFRFKRINVLPTEVSMEKSDRYWFAHD